MKILLVSNMYPSKKYPSYGIFVENTEKMLIEEKHTVYKIIMNKKLMKISKVTNYIVFYLKILFKGYFNNYDVIYVHFAAHCSIPFLILKKIKKDIKIIINVHGSDIVPQTEIQEKLQKYVNKFVKIADKIIVPSEYFKNLVSEKCKVCNDKIFVFPSGGINPKVFFKISDKEKLFEELNLDRNYKYIGFVGRIDYKKGWDIFLESLAVLNRDGLLNDKKAIIVGDGKQVDKLNETIKNLKLEKYIIRYDLLCQKELNKIYNCLSVFCFPTLGESLGLVGIEVMACGVPVIGSNIGALKEYIFDDQNGYKFIPGDPIDLSKKLENYFQKDIIEKETLSSNAYKTSTKYDKNKIKEELLSVFKEYFNKN